MYTYRWGGGAAQGPCNSPSQKFAGQGPGATRPPTNSKTQKISGQGHRAACKAPKNQNIRNSTNQWSGFWSYHAPPQNFSCHGHRAARPQKFKASMARALELPYPQN